MKIDIYGRIDRFDYHEAIDFDRPFETWSIFDETSDMGVFEGAESNGDVRISSKLIFVVELSFASVGATTVPMTSISSSSGPPDLRVVVHV